MLLAHDKRKLFPVPNTLSKQDQGIELDKEEQYPLEEICRVHLVSVIHH